MAKKEKPQKMPGQGDAQEYVVEGATLKCSCGDRTSKLQTPGRKNVRIQNKLQANIMDFKPMKNIQPFGQCSSLTNPTVAAATAANHGRLKKMPCVPNITISWINGKSDNKMDGAPALLAKSTNCCLYGGVISITDSGQTTKPEGDRSKAKRKKPDVARQIYEDWRNYWTPIANKSHLEERALSEKLRKQDPVGFGVKKDFFDKGKDDALGAQYKKVYYESQYSGMMMENLEPALNWIENQVTIGHNPSRTEIDDYVYKYAKAKGVAEPILSALLFLGMGMGSNGLKRAQGESKVKTGATRVEAEKIDPVESTKIECNKIRRVKVRRQIDGKYRGKEFCSDPVDVITGEVNLDLQDFVLPGRIPIQWTRHYGSQSAYRGLCGCGWETPGDVRLEFGEDGTVLFHDGSGAPTYFPALPAITPVVDPIEGRLLQREDGYYTIRFKEGLTYYFPISQAFVKRILVERVADPSGNAIQYLYDDNGLKEIRESSGRRIKVQSRQGRIESMYLYAPEHAPQLLVKYRYDEKADLTVVYDALGIPYQYVYQDNLLIRHTDRNGFSFHYEYDRYTREGRCVHVWGDGGIHEYRLVYHDDQKKVETVGVLGTTAYLYDESFRILQKTGPSGGVTQYEYDEAGRPAVVVNPDGHRTEYAYDRSGNLLKLTRPDGVAITTKYDANGKPLRITDPNGAVWSQEWDARGQLERRLSPLGAETQYQYDEHGQPVSHIDPMGNQTQLAFDDYGNLAGITDARGRTTRFTYDVWGNLVSRIDPLGRSVTYQYDLKGRLVKAVLPDNATIACEYDAEDNLISYRDENGAITRLEYCGVNELKRRIQPDGRTVEYEYNAEEQLIAVINQRGERYELKRDAAGRIIEEVDYWGQSRTYRYSAAGHLRESVDPLGRTIRYQTDPLGRILAKVRPDPAGTGNIQSETFTYDADGNLTACANRGIEVKRCFDREGKLIKEEQGPNCSVAYRYDLNGNQVSRTTAIQEGKLIRTQTVNYSYDGLGQAAAVEIAGHQPIRFNRNNLGQVINETLGNNLKRWFHYDDAGRLITQAVTNGTGPLFKQEYSYDKAGNLIRKEDSVFGTDRFCYDPLGRITRQIDPLGRVQQYLYDQAGDRLVTAINASAPDDPDSKWERTGELAGQTYRFDRAGNLVGRGGALGTTEFVWDVNGRLEKSIRDGQVTSYRYDPLGRRISKETGGVTTRFFWDGDALMGDARLEAGGDPGNIEPVCTRIREWVDYPGSFEPLALVQVEHGKDETNVTERIFYYGNDPNGCPTRLIDDNCKVVWAAQYDAWGQVKKLPVNEVEQPLRLQGQYWDEETGLCYNRFRYYCPEIGSFISQDPLGLAAGVNLYQFAANTQGWADPLGLCKKKAKPITDPGRMLPAPKGTEPWMPGTPIKSYTVPKGGMEVEMAVARDNPPTPLSWYRPVLCSRDRHLPPVGHLP
jgi:RHS repeat-associated protein